MKKNILILSAIFLLTSLGLSGIFFGNLHAHTGYSDGIGTPLEAFEYARDIAKIDIQAITDHGHYLLYPLSDGSSRFNNTIEAAEFFSEEGNYIAITGFEWTLTGSGHITVYDTGQEWTDRNQNDLGGLYTWLYEKDSIGSFAHPGQMFGFFDDFNYSPKADTVMNLIELGNGSVSTNNNMNEEFFEKYLLALEMGWHVGAAANQDNHHGQWGNVNEARTAVVMDKLNLEELYSAMRSRHTYATEDADAEVSFRTGEYIGGDIVYRTDKAVLELFYSDPGEYVKSVELYSSEGKETIEIFDDEFDITVEINPQKKYQWYFFKITQNDENEIVTSPIWFQDPSETYIFNLNTYPGRIVPGKPFKFNYEISNNSPSEKELLFSIKNSDGINIFEKEYLLSGLSLVEEQIELNVLKPKISLYINGELYDEAEIPHVSFIAGVDTTHENYFLKEFQPLFDFLSEKNGEIKPIKGMLNQARLADSDILVICIPPEDAMMKSYTVLKEKEIGWLEEIIDRGSSLLFVFPQSGISKETVDSFNILLEQTGFPNRLIAGEERLENKILSQITSKGGLIQFISWEQAVGTGKIPSELEEFLKNYSVSR